MRGIFFRILLALLILPCISRGASWPETPWLNYVPQTSAVASAVAFISPYDLQFYRTMNIWKRLDKKYGDFQVNFIIVAMAEQGLPYGEEVVRDILKEYNYPLPVLLDLNSTFSKSWHAYISPTIDVSNKEGKITSFDVGGLDAVAFEKSLQRTLKENLVPSLPAREFNNDGDAKNCGHAHTVFVGERFGKAWTPDVLTIQGPWKNKPFWIEGPTSKSGQIELTITKGRVGILAQSEQNAKITVTVDGDKVPTEVRGRDIEEKAGQTFINVRDLKMYEVISHSSHLKDNQRLVFSTESRSLKLRAIETLPSCLEVE
jgi:hypothetical protein